MGVRSLFENPIPIELNSSSSLWEKYRPRKISDLIGLEMPKRVLRQYAASPFNKAWLFVGASGTGKTAMALALAAEIAAEVHVMPASECSRDKLNSLCEKCRGFPIDGFKRHLVLINEADTLSVRIQTDLRSRLEGPSRLQNVVWVFTATPSNNSTAGSPPDV
jgi:replication-associated recombination protein RarA